MENVTTSGKRRPCTKYYTIKNLYNKQDGVAYTVVIYFANPRHLPRFVQICLDMQGFPSCCRGNNLFLASKGAAARYNYVQQPLAHSPAGMSIRQTGRFEAPGGENSK